MNFLILINAQCVQSVNLYFTVQNINTVNNPDCQVNKKIHEMSKYGLKTFFFFSFQKSTIFCYRNSRKYYARKVKQLQVHIFQTFETVNCACRCLVWTYILLEVQNVSGQCMYMKTKTNKRIERDVKKKSKGKRCATKLCCKKHSTK